LSPMREIVSRLVDDFGYTRNVDVRAAPYDFRLSPQSNTEWCNDFKSLVEDIYEENGRTPATIVTHSMGGIYTIECLQRLQPPCSI